MRRDRTDLLLEILDSLLKTVPLLEIVRTVVRSASVDVRDALSVSVYKVGKCLVLGTVRPGRAGNRRRDPGISKLHLLTLFRQS